ncbi:hypothetical protein SKAU_G00365960 [Synaphobranchus kaupii]|uniref:Uncharacterized protein n=1 Tax=Synaphobranchus kaupii TaxID=118154 RepID=A0A9Q1EF34_SYNKA|nr:hypothetical protein SKAU_G00365960 [Synaphobranchus kaupii]
MLFIQHLASPRHFLAPPTSGRRPGQLPRARHCPSLQEVPIGSVTSQSLSSQKHRDTKVGREVHDHGTLGCQSPGSRLHSDIRPYQLLPVSIHPVAKGEAPPPTPASPANGGAPEHTTWRIPALRTEYDTLVFLQSGFCLH